MCYRPHDAYVRFDTHLELLFLHFDDLAALEVECERLGSRTLLLRATLRLATAAQRSAQLLSL